MKSKVWTSTFVLVGFLMASWTSPLWAGDVIKWTEEVKLSDGRIVRLDRRVEVAASGFPVQKQGGPTKVEFCYAPMNIHWKSGYGYSPDIFDIVDGKAYLHVPISDCFSCEKHGYPESSAVYFVWDDDHWKQIQHDEFPEASEWNLLMSPLAALGDEKNNPKGLLTLQKKLDRYDGSLRYQQKKFGWKRLSDSYYRRDSCSKCRGVRNHISGSTDFLNIFMEQGKASCQPATPTQGDKK